MIATLVILYIVGVFMAPVVMGAIEGNDEPREMEGPDIAACICWPLVALVVAAAMLGYLIAWPFNRLMAIGTKIRTAFKEEPRP